jgi:hypothetical protein
MWICSSTNHLLVKKKEDKIKGEQIQKFYVVQHYAYVLYSASTLKP